MAALSGAALVTSLAFASGAGAAVLVDQYGSFGAAGGVASHDPAGPNNATEFADDFVVPAGQTWSIEGLDIRGNAPPTSFTVSIYSNGAGVPGPLLAARPALVPGGISPDLVTNVTPPITLDPGTYWLAVQASLVGWGWVTRTVVTGSAAAWRTQQDGHTCEDTFKPLSTCFMGTPADAAFRINGTAQPIPVVTPPASTPVAKKKKCRKKRKAKAAKKKCRKRRR